MMDKWLEGKTKEDLLVYCTPGATWADSTIQKHGWALQLYEPVCKILEVPMFPLSEKNIIPFIKILASGVRYKMTSIKVNSDQLYYNFFTLFMFHQCIIIPSLRRLNFLETNEPLPYAFHLQLQKAIRDLKIDIQVLIRNKHLKKCEIH